MSKPGSDVVVPLLLLGGAGRRVVGPWLLLGGAASSVVGPWLLLGGAADSVVGPWLLLAGAASSVVGPWLLLGQQLGHLDTISRGRCRWLRLPGAARGAAAQADGDSLSRPRR